MKKVICLIVVTIVVTSCSKTSIPPVAPTLATLTTTEVSSITSITARFEGNIISDGKSRITEEGFCLNTTSKPTTSDIKVLDIIGFDSFSGGLVQLTRNTKYYVRAYAINSAGTAYGNEVSFTTLNDPTVTDFDGNIYNTVNIGTQVWMMQNLNTSHYRNGEVIPHFIDIPQWIGLTTGAWSHCDNQPFEDSIYGKLYNWYAVNDLGGLAPKGWHIPSDAEWSTLTTFLGGESVAGRKLKASSFGPLGFYEVCNESGFTGLPAGYLGSIKSAYSFSDPSYYANWWSSTEGGTASALGRGLYLDDTVYTNNFGFPNYKSSGLSVRCIKD